MIKDDIFFDGQKFNLLFKKYLSNFTKYLDEISLYSEKLFLYNKRHSLVSFNSVEEFFFKHVYDSLFPTVLCPDFFSTKEFLDIGTGAGIPGLILSICFPESLWILLEPKYKRVIFLEGVILELDIKNAIVFQERLENLKEIPERVISRATFPLKKMFLTLKKQHNLTVGLWIGKTFDNSILEKFNYEVFNYTLPEGFGTRKFLLVKF
ncbi:Ribosomal RNA small subunit methyltransferase G [Thermodesulfobium narugense DSM 14796]|uniref:Ribosomal RNA small subunit methyltransferase G n=1 Tax=Thermodesulfobium narugense DSM 14796 TaxID=747365 RepID=M1E996_9BACT|nr:RsmG family class I SAM-dependent methyltransferase [Thermodesulfobium narugense]AEE15455.1 Ribosomal RNA small subunit methyltransferase G [Thermodesulfobium narugense DSM 14796]